MGVTGIPASVALGVAGVEAGIDGVVVDAVGGGGACVGIGVGGSGVGDGVVVVAVFGTFGAAAGGVSSGNGVVGAPGPGAEAAVGIKVTVDSGVSVRANS